MTDQRNHGPGPRLYQTGERIPQGDSERKAAPMYRGLLGYFPAALFEVAVHSLESDRKHNPGNPTAPNWARGKSMDHEDCIVRHLIDAGKRPARGADGRFVRADDPANVSRRYHLTAIAWRALALLQEHCEAEGATPGVSCTFPGETRGHRLGEAQRRDALVGICIDPVHEGEPVALVELAHPAQRLAFEAFRREREPSVELGGAGE
jgi:hypothetical protein